MPSLALWLLLGAAATATCLAAVVVPLLRVMRLLFGSFRAQRTFLCSPIPGPALSSRITGHIPDMVGPKAAWMFAKFAQAYGPLFKVQAFNQFAVVLTDPDAIATITRKTAPHYMPKPHELYRVIEMGYSPRRPNLVSVSDGDYHKAVRQAAAPCFSLSNLKTVVPLVVDLTRRVADRMATQQVVDVTDGAKRITSDVMGELLLGEDLGGTRWEPSKYLDVFGYVLKAEAGVFSNPMHLWRLWDPEVRRQRHCLDVHNQLMDDKVARLRAHPPAQHTIAAHIMSAVDPATGRLLDDSQVKAEIATFMAAGFETTSHAITWSLTLLACHPDTQADVVAELAAAGLAGPGRRDFEASDLGRLPLLSAVIKEALRLCPPAPFGGTRQVVSEGAELCGYPVPKGTIVFVTLLPYSLATHSYGPDAAEFRPERWLAPAAAAAAAAAASGNEGHAGTQPASPDAAAAVTAGAAGGKQANGAGTAFGAAAPPDPFSFFTGPRDCIGQNLAKLELQVVLATLLARFTFSPGPELSTELALAAATGQPVVSAVHALAGVHMTLQPLSGRMWLQVAARG